MKFVNNRGKKIKGLTILPFSAAKTVFRLPSTDALRRIASNSSMSVRNWVGVTGIEAEWLGRTAGENGWGERLERMAGQNGWREWLGRMAGENSCGERLGSQWGLGE